MRTPLQGGLPLVDTVDGAVVEVACDESGFSGTNLLDPASPLITHAGVDLSVDEAVAVITALRSRFSFAPNEFKSGQFLRNPAAADAVEWFLDQLRGRAFVQLVDKEYFLVTRVVDLLLAEPSYAAGTRLTAQNRPPALALYRARGAAGPGWHAFLDAFIELVRIKRRRRSGPEALAQFFAARDTLLRYNLGEPATEVLDALRHDRVQAVLARLIAEDRTIPPPLEPMLPALAETVLFFSGAEGRQVLIIHDEQSALTADRLTRLRQALADSTGASPLAGLVVVDSRDDPRVQAADLLAGMARRLPEIVDDGPLRPFISPTSLRDPSPGGPSPAATGEH
jgi:hypothetical protein